MKTARQMAMEILHAVFYEGRYSNKLIQNQLESSELSAADKRLARALIYGVIERSMTLDFYIGKLSSIRLKKIEPKTLVILKMAIYQIAYLDKIPNAAAVNEAVNLTKKVNFKSAGFVNGVLRSFLRLNGDYPVPDKKADLANYLSIQYSHPLWLVSRWLEQFGEAQTEKLLEADNQASKLTLRVNLNKMSVETVMKELIDHGYQAEVSNLIAYGILVEEVGNTPLTELEAFKQGGIFVQDMSAMLVGDFANPNAGESVLDMCAAPGGKSTHLAELMGNMGHVTARDVSLGKVALIKENADRLGLSCIDSQVGDALIFNENDIEKYDTLILDAPCSGLGIIRRKPEIRYNRKPEDIVALSNIQKEMLRHAAQYVKPGGQLIYSTCTIDDAENDQVIDWFLNEFKSYQLAPLPERYLTISASDRVIKLYQTQEGLDGFYIAKLIHSI